jgi:hypothetical protein
VPLTFGRYVPVTRSCRGRCPWHIRLRIHRGSRSYIAWPSEHLALILIVAAKAGACPKAKSRAIPASDRFQWRCSARRVRRGMPVSLW